MASSGYSAPPPPVFSGEGYSIWSVKMKAYLKAFDLWEVTETGRQPGPLREDPTLAQLKAHSEECAKGFKALSCIHSAVSDVIFTRIMACETAKQAWDRLKEEFHGSESSKQMSVLNLRREFEVLKMKESETLKEYTDRLMRSENEPTLYVSGDGDDSQLIVSLYVDDMLVTGGNFQLLNDFKLKMQTEFEMSDLGSMSYFLGLEIEQGTEGIFVSQRKYALEILKRYNMDKCKSVAIPLVVNEKLSKEDGAEKADASMYRSLVGSLLYLTATRTDLICIRDATGKKAFDPLEQNSGKKLVEWIWDLYGSGKLSLAIGERFHQDFDEKQEECLMVLGLWCAHPDYNLRLTIRQAVHVLNFIVELPNLPTKLPVPMYHVPPPSVSCGGAAPSVGAIELNSDTYQCQVGRATYAEKVQVWDSKTQKLSDFTTRFTSTVDIQRRFIYTSGFAFFLAPVGFQVPVNSVGGFLGLYNITTMNSTNQVLHIEFDANPDPQWDPLFEHVGININSLSSSTYTRWNVALHSGDNADVWINYNGSTKNLSVSWKYALTDNSQEITSLSSVVDLREVLPQWVTIGFSAATRDYVERHAILSWEFSSSLETDETDQENARKIKLVILVVVAACVLIGAVIIAFGVRWTKKMMRGIIETINLMSINDDLERGRGLQRFSYNKLASATSNFSNDTKFVEGGFHSVHKGHLTHSNMSVAVTKYLWGSKLTKKEYVTGMKIISRLKHRNLLQLVGWCHEEGKFLLVYELLPNGSLDSHLFGNRTRLTCDMRYRITHGLASALVYLHEGLEQRLVHGDVKSSNIMLDSNFNAKLCDFGLARFMNQELVRQNAGLAEAEGYMAPEYISTGEASKESDVYGFGLLALEIAKKSARSH
ncbi:hypothetical protein GH714_016754 [Hevea brasiliensis]|uniref:Protein kinase domain-containing protein n=1 Tax=Hevea brasiliensis TaxID=3981 RepID=A0A6A6K6R4_HEVBR|nr:hypothetical protein GH714_016754 [Hevea brasiliensis]